MENYRYDFHFYPIKFKQAMENYRYDFHFYPCDENGNVIEEQAIHFSSNDLVTGLNKAAQFYRSQKYVPTVNIFDNETNEYIAEWD